MEIILLVAGCIFGATVAIATARARERSTMAAAQEHARETVRQAELQREARLEDARAEAESARAMAATEIEERTTQLKSTETRVNEKSDNLGRKSQSNGDRDRNLERGEIDLDQLRDRLEELESDKTARLSELAGVPVEQAATELLQQVEQGLRLDAQTRMRDTEAALRENADDQARRLIADTAQRLSTPIVPMSAGSTLPLTERETQRLNSRGNLLEQVGELAGATITLAEDGTSVSISSADAVRRELAKAALTEILTKGRTSEKDVIRMIERQEQRFEKSIWESGIAAARKAGVGRLPEPVIQTFGRLNYRYSYGQNQLAHAVETAHLAAMLARELGADVDIARAGGLLHDLGKAVAREIEGTHAALGAQLALDAGMDQRVVHCIEAHHEEIEPSTTEALITIVADAMSGARPGARRESMDNYLARLQALEAVAMSFPGVDKCYAIQAGRELRVIVNPHTVDDPASARMAQAISEKVQETLDYPGQIKVMVIREVTSVEHARAS